MKQSLRKSHSLIWKIMMFVIPGIILAALYVKQDASQLQPPTQISPPASPTDSAVESGS